MPYPSYQVGGGVTPTVIAPNLPQHARGNTVIFEQDFFDDAPVNASASVPVNASAYPAWVVVDPSGQQVGSGVAIPGSQTGRWQFTWTVTTDAVLSTKDTKWRVLWKMLTVSNRQLEKEQQFDVIELLTPATLEDNRSYSYLCMEGQPETFILRRPMRPFQLTLSIFPAASSAVVPSTTALYTASLADSTIKEVVEGSTYSYLFETPAALTAGEYLVIWTVRDTLTSPRDSIVQKAVTPPQVFWAIAPELKTFMDKLRKPMGTVQAYTDADLYSYMANGIGILNGAVPVTNWNFTYFPWNYSTRYFLIIASALFGLQAQHLLEVELSFNFSGQTVTLDVDRTGGYEGVIGRLIEALTGSGNASWPTVKRNLVRNTRSMANVGVRAMGRRYNQQVVTRLSHGPIGGPGGDGQAIVDLLTTYGLI